jgi:hypothetical protein
MHMTAERSHNMVWLYSMTFIQHLHYSGEFNNLKLPIFDKPIALNTFFCIFFYFFLELFFSALGQIEDQFQSNEAIHFPPVLCHKMVMVRLCFSIPDCFNTFSVGFMFNDVVNICSKLQDHRLIFLPGRHSMSTIISDMVSNVISRNNYQICRPQSSWICY